MFPFDDVIVRGLYLSAEEFDIQDEIPMANDIKPIVYLTHISLVAEMISR